MSVSSVTAGSKEIVPIERALVFERAVAPFKQCIWALDSGDLARVVMQELNEFITTPALDVTDGIKQYFNGKGLSADLIQSLEGLDRYVKRQISHENTVKLKEDVGKLASEFSQYVQTTFHSYEDLVALAQQQEASGQIQQAVRSLYMAAMEVADDLDRLRPVIVNIDRLDPNRHNLSRDERVQLAFFHHFLQQRQENSQLRQEVSQLRQDLDVTRAALRVRQSVLSFGLMAFVSLGARTSCVERGLNNMASHVEPLVLESPFILEAARQAKLQTIRDEIAFGPKQWEKYFGDVGKAPPLPEGIERILESQCPYHRGKLVSQTHMLVLIPATVKSKPFTLNYLGKLIGKPKAQARPTRYSYFRQPVKDQMGDVSPKKSFWSLITKDLVPGSCDRDYQEQKEALNTNSRVPRALEAVTAMLMHHVITGDMLYTGQKFTRVAEKVDGYRVSVGGFQSEKLFISYFDDKPTSYAGMCAAWRLETAP